MATAFDIKPVIRSVTADRDRLRSLREIILANVVMCGEIPSPTFGEAALIRFICDRFTEGKLHNISVDETGSASALLPGRNRERNILVAVHADRIWDERTDHTISVGTERIRGPGVGDNSLGVAALVSLPDILERLGLELDCSLIFLAASRSLGRGNLEGFRFFVDNAKLPIHAALCIEGMQLGRLSYSSLGMARAEISLQCPAESDWRAWGSSGAIVGIHQIVDRILAIQTPQKPHTSIILGSVSAGSGYNVPPVKATLRFEIRSEQQRMVSQVLARIEDIIDEINTEQHARAELSLIARRKPGGISFNHPLVKSARDILQALGVKPRIAPSTSELSALVDKRIPALTLGLTVGERKHELDESVQIEPVFTGLAQIIGVLKAIDGGVCDGQD